MCKLKSKQSRFSLLQTDTKPVQMMNMEATFCMGNIDSINCKIIELPFQNKHLSMFILLPKDVEDESTGLEKVRRRQVLSTKAPPVLAKSRADRAVWAKRAGLAALLIVIGSVTSKVPCFFLGPFLLNINNSQHLFGTYSVLGTVLSCLHALSHLILTAG